MDLRKKANFTGDIAIGCGIISWALSIFDAVLNGNWTGCIIFSLMIICIHFRDKYLEIRKKEIDKMIEEEKDR